jgi:hypothetical protein
MGSVGRGSTATRRTTGFSHREKRLLVLGRLTQADADSLSDRAVARELGVSQPFVGAMRRRFLAQALDAAAKRRNDVFAEPAGRSYA